MTNDSLDGIKSKHLMDMKRDHERAIEMEYADVGRAMGYPVEADQDQIAAIQARIDDIDGELVSRGIDPDDGYTITDDGRYEAHCDAHKG